MSITLIIAIVLIIVGIIGAVLPAIPGITLVFGGLVLAASADNFQRVGRLTLIVLGILTALSFAIDFAATAMGAKKFGASKLALIGAALGTLLGLVAGPIGIVVGPFLGATIGELIARRDAVKSRLLKEHLPQASRVGFGATLGLLVGVVGKLLTAALMIGIFLSVYFSSK